MIRYVALLFTCLGLFSQALAQLQENIHLTATNAVLEFQDGTYHLWDHVRVESPGVLSLKCDDLRATVPQDKSVTTTSNGAPAGRLQSLIATGNVQIELYQKGTGGLTNIVRAFGNQAEYGATNEVLILTGNPRIETPSGTMIGTEALIYDLKTRSMRNRGPYRIELRSDILKKSILFNQSVSPSPKR